MDKLHELGFEVIDHPPYSPDLAPSDFYLFANLKRHLAGQRYATISDVKCAVESYFESKEADFYRTGIVKLKSRWERCIDLDGDYVE